MFDWQPIDTDNILTIVQIIAIIIGFFFSWRSLEASRASLVTATANAQAQLYNQMVLQGRELNFKFMEIYHDEGTDENKRAKKDLFVGMVIAYYAACFEMSKVLPLTESLEKLLNFEIKEIMKKVEFRRKWEDVRNGHSREFNAHVNSIIGV